MNDPRGDHDRGDGSRPRRPRRRRRGDHRHRHPADRRVPGGRVVSPGGWPRAPACSRPRSRDDARPPRHRRRDRLRRTGQGAAGGDVHDLRPRRLRRLPVDQRHRAAHGVRGVTSGCRPGRAHRRSDRGLPTSPPAGRRRRGRHHDIAIEVRGAASVDDALEEVAERRPQQPLQVRDLRRRPELGARSRGGRHDGRDNSIPTPSTSP